MMTWKNLEHYARALCVFSLGAFPLTLKLRKLKLQIENTAKKKTILKTFPTYCKNCNGKTILQVTYIKSHMTWHGKVR